MMSVVLLSSISHANIVCQSRSNLPYVQLEINETNKSYFISIIGYRTNINTEYVFTKTVTEFTTNPFYINEYDVIIKTKDLSTWNNMPNVLYLKSQLSILPHNSYELSGLNTILGFGETVFFNPQNCFYSWEQE